METTSQNELLNREPKPLQHNKWTADDITDQSGKVFIITGANSGLGYEAAYQLARHNATVVLACRSIEKGQEAFNAIRNDFPDSDLHLIQLDLSSFDSIREFTDKFKQDFDELHGLLNNAGIMQPPRRETEDGFELQFGVNHLGHFLLTEELYEILQNTPGARVINQSSFAHKSGDVIFDDINWEESYSRTGAYSQSKMANLYFTYEMHRRLNETDEDIKAIAVHPGYTATDLQHNGPTVGGKSIWSRIYTLTNKILAQDVSMGTLPLLYATVADDVESGDFIGPGGFLGIRGHPKRVKSDKKSYNKENSKRLWEISEKFIGTEFRL